jgi:hypothetical protein
MSDFDESTYFDESVEIESLNGSNYNDFPELSDDELINIIKKNDKRSVEFLNLQYNILDKKIIITEKEIYYNSLINEEYITIDNNILNDFISIKPFHIFINDNFDKLGTSLIEIINIPNL